MQQLVISGMIKNSLDGLPNGVVLGQDWEVARPPYPLYFLQMFRILGIVFAISRSRLCDSLSNRWNDRAEGDSNLFVHFIASVIDRKQDTSNDASTEPRYCLSLWKCMKRYQNFEYTISPSLDQKNALSEVVRKSDVIQWETVLKDQLAEWMADPKSPVDVLLRRPGAAVPVAASSRRRHRWGRTHRCRLLPRWHPLAVMCCYRRIP
jgi:hypothetical protein